MENNNVETQTQNTQTTETDYKAEYEKLKLEVEKQKKLKDDYAKENAEYKRKEVEKMTDEEKRAKELQEIIDSKNSLEAELQEIKLEREFLGNGFSNEESGKLKQHKIPLEAVKVIAEIIKKRVDDNTKSIRAESVKGTANNLMGSGNAKDSESAFAAYQKSKSKAKNKVEL